MLDREEYIEQAYFFRVLGDRMRQAIPVQELLVSLRDELLATTKLPLAIDFILSELRHAGVFATAMQRLGHYFTPFQTYVIEEAENERGGFDMRVALEVLRFEAAYRADGGTRQGTFIYQFETLCRNRLKYESGLTAVAGDPIYDDAWRRWILTVRSQVGIVDFADMVYVRSRYYWIKRNEEPQDLETPVLFGEKEGRIALANRRKEPLLLFAALQRQLGYPVIPRPAPIDEAVELLPALARRIERLETRLKLVEEEQRGGIDLSQFYTPPSDEAPQ